MMRFEARQMTGRLGYVYGIWNPNTRSWVKADRRDRLPAMFGQRDTAQKMADKLNAKYGR